MFLLLIECDPQKVLPVPGNKKFKNYARVSEVLSKEQKMFKIKKEFEFYNNYLKYELNNKTLEKITIILA